MKTRKTSSIILALGVTVGLMIAPRLDAALAPLGSQGWPGAGFGTPSTEGWNSGSSGTMANVFNADGSILQVIDGSYTSIFNLGQSAQYGGDWVGGGPFPPHSFIPP